MTPSRTSMGVLPHKVAFALLLAAWCALFHFLGNTSFGYVNTPSMFGWLIGWYQLTMPVETGDELCPFVPFAVATLLYLRRDDFKGIAKQPWPPALALVLLGSVMHVVGYLCQQTRISVAGFIVGGFGLMGLVWGFAWMRLIAFPWFMLLFAIPFGTSLDTITFRMRLLSTNLSVAVCKGVFGLPLVSRGNLVGMAPSGSHPGFQFEVAAACSGMRSVTVVILLSLFYAYLNFSSWWRRAIIVLTAIPLAITGNILRLIVVFLVGDAFGQARAKMIETNMGFITWAIALIGLFQIGRWLREEPASPTPAPVE